MCVCTYIEKLSFCGWEKKIKIKKKPSQTKRGLFEGRKGNACNTSATITLGDEDVHRLASATKRDVCAYTNINRVLEADILRFSLWALCRVSEETNIEELNSFFFFFFFLALKRFGSDRRTLRFSNQATCWICFSTSPHPLFTRVHVLVCEF